MARFCRSFRLPPHPIRGRNTGRSTGMGMKGMAIAAFAVAMAGGFAGSALAVDFTPAGKAAGDGIFTTDQSKRGEAIYNANCAMCHQPDLGGKEPVPELAGD